MIGDAMKYILSVFFLFLLSNNVIADEIKPSPFTALSVKHSDYALVCSNTAFCEKGVKLWRVNGDFVDLYVTTPGLRLTQMRLENGKYRAVHEWDFSKVEQRNELGDDDLAFDGAEIFPALYPVSKTKNAIALVTKWSSAYSGGGRVEHMADFFMLNDDNSYTPVVSDIPFYSKEQIKSCFTKSDYDKKSHCEDESWSILYIRIMDFGSDYYSWNFITKSYNWPAFVDKSKMTVSQTVEKIKILERVK